MGAWATCPMGYNAKSFGGPPNSGLVFLPDLALDLEQPDAQNPSKVQGCGLVSVLSPLAHPKPMHKLGHLPCLDLSSGQPR